MIAKPVIARNVLWNYGSMAAFMVAGFITAPLLVNRLGDEKYGLWLLIGTFTGYFGLLDLGLRASVGRFVAFHRARGEDEAVNQTVTTAFALLCIPLVLTVVGGILTVGWFFVIFDVPPADATSVRIALILMFANLALSFPLSLYDGVLWALQRFDVLSAVDIAQVAARTALTFYLISIGYGLAALTAVTLVTMIFGGAAKAYLAHRSCPGLVIRPEYWRGDRMRDMVGYGVWCFVASLSRMFTSQLSRIFIGSWVGVALVTPLGIASSLIGYGTSLLVAATGVLTPIATSLHAADKRAQQDQLCLIGGRLCSYYGFCILGWYLLLGHAFILLWMRREIHGAYPILAILALGEILPMTQSITGNILLGMARYRVVAYFSILEAALCVAGSLLLIGPFGVMGAAVSLAVSSALCRGLLVAIYGCREIGCGFKAFVHESFLPAMSYASVPLILLTSLVLWRKPVGAVDFVVYAGGYVMTCAAFGLRMVQAGPAARQRDSSAFPLIEAVATKEP
ncbi:MAG: oligosaccharide flippase family protein [Planctomycetaceae bacterium]